jgi:hypothetical protein
LSRHCPWEFFVAPLFIFLPPPINCRCQMWLVPRPSSNKPKRKVFAFFSYCLLCTPIEFLEYEYKSHEWERFHLPFLFSRAFSPRRHLTLKMPFSSWIMTFLPYRRYKNYEINQAIEMTFANSISKAIKFQFVLFPLYVYCIKAEYVKSTVPNSANGYEKKFSFVSWYSLKTENVNGSAGWRVDLYFGGCRRLRAILWILWGFLRNAIKGTRLKIEREKWRRLQLRQ